ncbi:MAG TPA: DUF1801 domain-containing protein [Vicinamibacterales bacterium]|nr:DUF1801 domain-containing protein [Vicinamibacterales bacterium]
MLTKTPPDLLDALRRFEPDATSTLIAARAVVLDVIGPCHESIFPIKKLVSVLYSTTEKRMKDNICLLVIYREHVNLMFPRGVDLKDPKGLLEGSGKAMRHVKLRTPDDADKAGVRQLIAQAKERKGLGKPAEPLRTVVTILKSKRAETAAPSWPRLF